MRKSLLIFTLSLIVFGEKTISTTVSLADVPTQESTSQVAPTTEPDIIGTWKSTGTNIDEIVNRILSTQDIPEDVHDDFQDYVAF